MLQYSNCIQTSEIKQFSITYINSSDIIRYMPDDSNPYLNPQPIVYKDKVLFAPGYWNGKYFSNNTVKNMFNHTDWNNESTRFLYFQHEDGSIDPVTNVRNPMTWVGYIKDEKIDSNGNVTGDVWIYNPITQLMVKTVKPKVIGVSASLGVNDTQMNGAFVSDGNFKNFSIVIDPAVNTAYLNNSKVVQDGKEIPIEIKNAIEAEVKLQINDSKADIKPEIKVDQCKEETPLPITVPDIKMPELPKETVIKMSEEKINPEVQTITQAVTAAPIVAQAPIVSAPHVDENLEKIKALEEKFARLEKANSEPQRMTQVTSAPTGTQLTGDIDIDMLGYLKEVTGYK